MGKILNMSERFPKSKKSNILKDKKQVKVGIPREIVENLQINPNEDIILWSIVSNKNREISLKGNLVKGGRKKK